MSGCAPEPTCAWYFHLEGGLAMAVASMAMYIVVKKLKLGNLLGQIASTYAAYALYYAAYYGRLTSSYPCYHASMESWVPDISKHQVVNSHAHPYWYGTAITVGLAVGYLIDEFDVHLHYCRRGRKSKWTTEIHENTVKSQTPSKHVLDVDY